MKLKLIPLLLLPFLFTLAACGGHSHGDVHIELNNGQKWKVNEEMKPHVEAGRAVLNTYLAEGGTDNKQLAEDLKEQNAKLIRSCTMDGKAHDELHNWLHPHLDLVKALAKAETANEVTQVTDQLKASYEIYDQHFE